MNASAALERIRELALGGRVFVSGHARARMRQRRVRYADIVHALRVAQSCIASEAPKWRVDSEDLDGDDLTIIVAIEDDAVVVTVY